MKNNFQIHTNQQNQLTPVTSEWMHRLMKEPVILTQLLSKYGSPLNILHPSSFHENSQRFNNLFSDYQIDGKIYYARKANKCKGFADQALKSGMGIDTASIKELQQSLDLGATGDDLVLTAAVKPNPLLKLAIQHGVTIIIDNAEECAFIQQVAEELNKKAVVGFRVSGFVVEGTKLYSRFGFDINQMEQFIHRNFIENNRYKSLEIKGLHFHLDGYSMKERGNALLQSIGIYKWMKEAGLPVQFIDIGGGILVNYLKEKSQWESFQEGLKESVLMEKEPVTFQNDGLGYKNRNNKIAGSLNTYPYYNETGSIGFLSTIFEYKGEVNDSVADHLRKENIQLRIEPGRALLNQSGITLATVVHRKVDTHGNQLVGLAMNMSQLNSSSADFLLDPFILSQQKKENKEVALYFSGAYCLEGDIILKRRMTFSHLPEKGNIVVFVNTAGYMMHFYERQSHLLPFSENLNFYQQNGQLAVSDFVPDDNV